MIKLEFVLVARLKGSSTGGSSGMVAATGGGGGAGRRGGAGVLMFSPLCINIAAMPLKFSCMLCNSPLLITLRTRDCSFALVSALGRGETSAATAEEAAAVHGASPPRAGEEGALWLCITRL